MTLLLNAGADPNVSDQYGVYPIHLAVLDPGLECLRLLLAAGADTTVRDDEGETAAEIATRLGLRDALSLLS